MIGLANGSALRMSISNTPFYDECEQVREWLGQHVEPGFCGQVGITFDVQDGVVRGTETVVRQTHRKKR
jgi:hypothetical protein